MSARRELHFGFSPCPNDTFAFWAALHGRVPNDAVELRAGVMEDIEALNRRAITGSGPPVTKLSVPALAAVTADFAVLPAGAALGFGCGPLIVRRSDRDDLADLQRLPGRRVAVPGRHTTAVLLFRLFVGPDCELVEMPFDRVMAAVADGRCDAGVVIHEGRFTYRERGLVAIADLGQLWEGTSGLPLPLGVIAMRRDLGRELHDGVGRLLRASVEFALADREAPRAFVRQHAQEIDDEVCDSHIELYVNDFTVDLGRPGRAAIEELLRRGRECGALPDGPSPWLEDA